MISLIYASSAKQMFSKEQLLTLLEHCREKNLLRGITGMLLYKDGNFLQALEGPPDEVRKTFSIIQTDNRHGGVLKLMERPIEEREFAEWTMGFRNLNGMPSDETPGYSNFLNESSDKEVFPHDPGRAAKLLLMFRQNM